MITSAHLMIYSDDPPATRAFLRDVLRLPWVADAGSSPGADTDTPGEAAWLIFATGPSELGVHPTSGEWEGQHYTNPRTHLITFMCDDIDATVAELSERGATFAGEVADHGYGLVAMMQVPGADDVQVYQPRHATAYDKTR